MSPILRLALQATNDVRDGAAKADKYLTVLGVHVEKLNVSVRAKRTIFVDFVLARIGLQRAMVPRVRAKPTFMVSCASEDVGEPPPQDHGPN